MKIIKRNPAKARSRPQTLSNSRPRTPESPSALKPSLRKPQTQT